MRIEIGAPACLPLGMIWIEQAGRLQPGLIGVTLQHPPVHLLVNASGSLQATGARADAACRAAENFLTFHRLPGHAKLDIELAIPMFMGLGSDSMLALSVARALAMLYNLALDDTPTLAHAVGIGTQHALEISSFARGGVLCVPAPIPNATVPPLLHRYEVAHPEKHAWAFVLVFPRVSRDTPVTLEHDRLAALYHAVPHLDQAVATIVHERLSPALTYSDVAGFGAALMQIQHFTQAALEYSGGGHPFSAQEQAILDVLRNNGAIACGRSATGLALYGLVEGAEASRVARKAVRQMIGPFGGRVMATIIDNQGARTTMRAISL